MGLKRFTIMYIPSGSSQTRQFFIPTIFVKIAFIFLIFCAVASGFLWVDYLQLRKMRERHQELIAENQHMHGEAEILITNLNKVKRSLRRIQDYTQQLGELVNIRVNKVSKRTGIGPLAAEEFSLQKLQGSSETEKEVKSEIPLGINIDNLIFRPALDALSSVEQASNSQAIELQQLLSTLSEKKSLLASMPSLAPVQGWITSTFGMRVSPFTEKRGLHQAIDIAAPVGSPVIAPADGVVIYAGTKEGFGNFIMIAHYGYGIVTRFGHNAQNMVQAGQRVRRGEQIATVGMTGRTTGPHLHYEIWVNGRAENPERFILDTQLEF